MSVIDVVKRLAMARPDVGFTLNNKWRFPKKQDLSQRIIGVMGDDVQGRMLAVDAQSASDATLRLCGFISEPTLRRASSVDQYLFVNGRPVRDKVLIGALRAAYMDVMHAREFPLCALYLTLSPRSVDVNVSPAKTDVHFLEPSHIRSFIIKSLRDVLGQTLVQNTPSIIPTSREHAAPYTMNFKLRDARVCAPNRGPDSAFMFSAPTDCAQSSSVLYDNSTTVQPDAQQNATDMPLGHVIGQIGNKYILAQSGENLVIVDQHAAHERITYERLRQHAIKVQPLLTPIVVNLRPEDAAAVLSVAADMHESGVHIEEFGDNAIAIFEKPADWDLDWESLFHAIADEVRDYGHSAQLGERLHLKLANYACHHSVRAGQKLDMVQMDALLRDIERTQHGGECNHGRPVYKFIPLSDIDGWFERS